MCIFVLESFVSVVDKIINLGSKYYIETKRGSLVNIRPSNFKKLLGAVVGQENINKHLNYYKRLGFIIVDDEDRFTNIQWINKKSVRVISVRKDSYLVLKELMELKDGDA